jgi:ribose 5-phosphate isomerase B
MQIYIASDHAGIKFKEFLVTSLSSSPKFPDLKIKDLGPFTEESVDYPDFAKALCNEIIKTPSAKGILICGSGQGMAMAANKFSEIRAALCWDGPSARLSREHNDANVLCLGARLIPEGLALEIAQVWLTTKFLEGRHQKRVEKLSKLP